MKYHRLTHEQFEELHHEFAVFLASQGLDHAKWKEIKKNDSERVVSLLDLFSDVVWDKIVSECSYLEFSTPDQLFLIDTSKQKALAIVIKVNYKQIDLTTEEGFQWILNHIDSDKVNLFKGSNSYQPSKNEFVYAYLKKGAIRTDGKRFKALQTYFSNSAK